MTDAEEIVLDNLDDNQRAAIAKIERKTFEQPKAYLERGTILLSFYDPNTEIDSLFELHIEGKDGKYTATVLDKEERDIVASFEPDALVLDLFRNAVGAIGEIIVRTKRN